MKKKEIKVRVGFSEGYEKRYTEACLKVLEHRKAEKNLKGATKCMQKETDERSPRRLKLA